MMDETEVVRPCTTAPNASGTASVGAWQSWKVGYELPHSGTLDFGYAAGAVATIVALALLNRSRVYSVAPYALLGIVLWACVRATGSHAASLFFEIRISHSWSWKAG